MLTKIFFQLFIVLLCHQTISTLQCFECKNCTTVDCKCDTTYNISESDSFCLLLRETLSNGKNRYEIVHAPKYSRPFSLLNLDFISVEESIQYNESTNQWLSRSTKISYGCTEDLCNKDHLLKQLPSNGLEFMLPIDWLNDRLQRKHPDDFALCRSSNGLTICANSLDAINRTLCPRSDCSGTCFLEENIQQNQTTEYCLTLGCTSDEQINDQTRLPSEVVISAVYYLKTRTFQIYELRLQCNGDRCDKFDLFTDVETKLQMNLNNIRAFLPIPNHVQSIYSISISYLIAIIFIQIFLFY